MVRRFGLYFIGIALGTALSFAIFGSRSISCSYFPNDRLLYDISKKTVIWSANAECNLNCAAGDSTAFLETLRNGDVDFNTKTKWNDTCTRYIISHPDNLLELEIDNCDSTATIVSVEWLEAKLTCNCP